MGGFHLLFLKSATSTAEVSVTFVTCLVFDIWNDISQSSFCITLQNCIVSQIRDDW